MNDFNVSSVTGPSNYYNPQITNKVATINTDANLMNTAANQSAFSSYIGQALAQIGLANPTTLSAPVVSGANKTEQDTQKTLSNFINKLFFVLTEKNSQQSSTPANQPFDQVVDDANASSSRNAALARSFLVEETTDTTTASTLEETNPAIAAYTGASSTTVGNIVSGLQSLVQQLNLASRSVESEDGQRANESDLQALEEGFNSILHAQGADEDNKATLGAFLQTLAQNLQGQSPVGIIINTQA